MFVQNFIKLSSAVYKLSHWHRENTFRWCWKLLPLLPRAVEIPLNINITLFFNKNMAWCGCGVLIVIYESPIVHHYIAIVSINSDSSTLPNYTGPDRYNSAPHSIPRGISYTLKPTSCPEKIFYSIFYLAFVRLNIFSQFWAMFISIYSDN